MPDDRWARLESLFAEAVALDPAERSAFVARACGEDAGLRAELEALLRNDEPGAGEAGERDRSGETIGAYRIVGRIGSGGMGAVWLAERDDDRFAKKVAIKFVREGLGDDVLRRFRLERRILAQLSHPNIAQLLDAGRTPEGVPYFVLEYVDGVPIDAWCAERRPPLRRRVELFREVCGAVQFAHRNLVVHRDLKPGNILVTADGVPKLLDFGIAKLLDAAADAPVTLRGFRPMTPQFASPEQIRGEPVTTATDVYSLGILLYLVLAGRLPYEVDASSPGSWERVVSDTNPRPPSAVADPSAARRMRGDLDRVVLKAVEKDPALRYPSAQELADDLGRFLAHEPVRARAPSASYRFSRFVRRHRAGVAAAAVALAALVTGAAVASVGLVRATRARHLAEREAETTAEVSRFLRDMLGAVQPSKARGREVTVRDVLDDAAAKIDGRFPGRPSTEGEIRKTIGETYLSLGDTGRAIPQLERAYALLRDARGDDDESVVEALNRIGEAAWRAGDLKRSLEVSTKILEIRRRTVGEEHKEYSATLANLADTYADLGDVERAESLLRRAVEIDRRVLQGDDRKDLAYSVNNLATVLVDRKEFDEAIPLDEESLELRRRYFGEDSPEVATSLGNLGAALLGAGKADRAVEVLRDAVARSETLYDEDHPRLADARRNLASALLRQGRPQEAEGLIRRAIAAYEKATGPESWMTGSARATLGRILGAEAKRDEALRELRAGRAILAAALGGSHPRVAEADEALREIGAGR